MRFRVYAKAQDAGWLRDWFWAPDDEEPTVRDEHGPYPLKLWARLAAMVAWVRGGGERMTPSCMSASGIARPEVWIKDYVSSCCPRDVGLPLASAYQSENRLARDLHLYGLRQQFSRAGEAMTLPEISASRPRLLDLFCGAGGAAMGGGSV